jgi:hypothetical protein
MWLVGAGTARRRGVGRHLHWVWRQLFNAVSSARLPGRPEVHILVASIRSTSALHCISTCCSNLFASNTPATSGTINASNTPAVLFKYCRKFGLDFAEAKSKAVTPGCDMIIYVSLGHDESTCEICVSINDAEASCACERAESKSLSP